MQGFLVVPSPWSHKRSLAVPAWAQPWPQPSSSPARTLRRTTRPCPPDCHMTTKQEILRSHWFWVSKRTLHDLTPNLLFMGRNRLLQSNFHALFQWCCWPCFPADHEKGPIINLTKLISTRSGELPDLSQQPLELQVLNQCRQIPKMSWKWFLEIQRSPRSFLRGTLPSSNYFCSLQV